MEKMDQMKKLDRELEQPADFTSPEELYQDLIASIQRYHPSDDISMVEKAYRLAFEAHKDQKRNRVNHTSSIPLRGYYPG